MRLRLTVQRHGLPPVQVLWSLASAVRPPLLAVGNSITISQFLEQVSEVIPLESEDWGLEDYSVEVRGFECLHFAELNQVLKEDDEVCIRPLQTQDLRFRKISGRHQIDSDGKHLVDGVAFGRPFLRRADRPAINIPPRKRRRITYDEEDDFDEREPINDRQVMIRAGFDDTDDATAGNESDDEEDFAPDEEEEDDLGAELEDLQKDFNDDAEADEGVGQDDVQQQRFTRSRRSPKGLGLLQLLDEDGRPFAGQYNNPLLDFYGQVEASSSRPEIRLGKRGTAHLTQNSPDNIRSILRDPSSSPQRVSRRDSAGSNRSVRFENAERATPATIRESEGSEDADDGDFELGEVDESDKENAEPLLEETESSDSFFEGSQTSSSSSSDDQLSDDETSSSGSSSSDSSSASEPEQQSSKDIDHRSETSETSSSGATSSSSSDSEPEPPQTGQKRKRAVHNVKAKRPTENLPSVVTIPALTTTPPASGSTSTRNRNKRRKESKRLSFMKSKGILPATATKADLFRFEEGTSLPERQEMMAVGEVHAAFEAKRQKLLTSISAGGIDVSLDPSLQENDAGMTQDTLLVDDPLSRTAATQDTLMTDQRVSEEGLEDVEPENPPAKDSNSILTTAEVQGSATGSSVKAKKIPLPESTGSSTTEIVPDSITAPHVETMESPVNGSRSTPVASKTTESPRPESQHRRSKLDMSGAKRMLFGSLGLRTPKTKDDEIKTREKLMRDVRPIKEPHVNEKIEKAEDIAAAAGDESWKDKIDLRAVECCYEGVELSTPPFPFVQRWDPQQQRGYNTGNAKKRKGKKRKRNNDDYYEDRSYQSQDRAARRDNPAHHEDNLYDRQNKAVRFNENDWPKQEAEQYPSTEKADAESKTQEHLHDENFEDSRRANKQLLHETEGASADTLVEVDLTNDLTNDLPILPKDLTRCTSLTLDTTAKGTIVAFKQLEMSAETNWQPRISEYRTAIIDEILDDGTLSMTLAKRDQPLQDIQYDEKTGERLYSKFEMPGYHDEIGEDNNGRIDISFDELISPMLVKTTDKRDNQDDIMQAQDHVIDPLDLNNKAITKVAQVIEHGPQVMSLDDPAQATSNEEAAEPSEEVRQEISELIRDAGWRSSIANNELNDRQDVHNRPAFVGSSSPKFRGFSSSPPTNGFPAPSSPPQVSTPSLEIGESAPTRGPNDSPARSIISNHRSAIDYPNLPQLKEDSEIFQQEAQDRSGLPDHQIESQDLIPSQSIASPTLTSPEKSSPKIVHPFDGADSDESLPELFSQAFEQRMSQGREIKPQLSEEDPISPPSHRNSKRNRRVISSERGSDHDWEPNYSDVEHGDDSASTQRPSQPYFSSQIVDLTISSDTVDPPDDSYNDDSYVLPIGAGWVQKSRTSKPSDSSRKRTAKRGSTRNR